MGHSSQGRVSLMRWEVDSYIEIGERKSFYQGNRKFSVNFLRKHPYYNGVVTCLMGESSVHFFKINLNNIRQTEHFMLAHRLRNTVDYRIVSKDKTLV